MVKFLQAKPIPKSAEAATVEGMKSEKREHSSKNLKSQVHVPSHHPKPVQLTSRHAKLDRFHSSMPSSSGEGRDAGTAGAGAEGAGGALVALNQVTLEMARQRLPENVRNVTTNGKGAYLPYLVYQ